METCEVGEPPRPTDPLAIPEAFGDVPADQVSPEAAEEPGDDHGEPVEVQEPPAEETKAPRGVGKLIASLLVDPEAFDYPTICDIVRGEFPNARTSTRSIASVAAGLRRNGVEVPMRRNAKG